MCEYASSTITEYGPRSWAGSWARPLLSKAGAAAVGENIGLNSLSNIIFAFRFDAQKTCILFSDCSLRLRLRKNIHLSRRQSKLSAANAHYFLPSRSAYETPLLFERRSLLKTAELRRGFLNFSSSWVFFILSDRLLATIWKTFGYSIHYIHCSY